MIANHDIMSRRVSVSPFRRVGAEYSLSRLTLDRSDLKAMLGNSKELGLLWLLCTRY
jgi:hypothetical protein